MTHKSLSGSLAQVMFKKYVKLLPIKHCNNATQCSAAINKI